MALLKWYWALVTMVFPLLVAYLFIQPQVNRIIKLPSTEHPIILYWTDFHGVTWLEKEGLYECGQYKCHFTTNRDLFYNSSLVVFHICTRSFLKHILSLFAFNNYRPRGQRWVYVNAESPVNIPIYHFLNRPLFNWTMTYRLNSDVFGGYGEVIPGIYQDGFNQKTDYLEGKSIEATAVISNCFSFGRLNAVRALSKHMQVNLLGRCAGTIWSFGGSYSTTEDRNSQIRKSKFYLAFENSICKDYITEKTYHNALFNRAVPVIMSGANLSNPLVMPPGSYIDASTFNSAKELADHLIYIGQSKKRYNKFFEWREHWTIRESSFAVQRCHLCEALHQSNSLDIKVYKDLSGLKERETECKPYPSL